MAMLTKKEDIKTHTDLCVFIDQQRHHIRFSILFGLFFEIPSLALVLKLLSSSQDMGEYLILIWAILGGASITIMIVVGRFTFEEIQKSRRKIAEAKSAFYKRENI